MVDSTAQQAFATWYVLINTTNDCDITAHELDQPSVIDIINKKHKTEIGNKEGSYELCFPMPGAPGDYPAKNLG